jgi:Putative beta-lactamase-inhibitor-like, PepSY-like
MKTLMVAFGLLAATSCMSQKDVPAAVKDAFTKNFPGITVEKWDNEDGNYEAEFTKDGKKMSAVFDAKGAWMETETDIEIKDLPAPVAAYIKEHYKGAAIKEAAIIKTSKGEMYEAEVNRKDLLFDKQGNFIKEAAADDNDKEDEE